MKRIAILLVTTGIAGAASAHPEPETKPRGCSTIEVTAPDVKKPPRGLLFSTREIVDLAFETELERAADGPHVLHFKVLTPSGFLYQDLAMPFNWQRPGRHGEAVVPAASVSTAGLPVQQLEASSSDGHGRGRRSVHARLPVAGTSITMSTLYGRWSVQAFLDDHTSPCSPVTAFTISSK